MSGKPLTEDMSLMLRSMTLASSPSCEQDYVVLPDQRWVDGSSTSPGIVKQFVTTPILSNDLEDMPRSNALGQDLGAAAGVPNNGHSTPVVMLKSCENHMD